MYNISNKKELKGFTLAELLITITIIGVIAAITVPSLIYRTNNQEYVAKLKKAHSLLNQAAFKIVENNGYSQGDYSFLNNVDTFYGEFQKVVNVNKQCQTIDDCMLTGQYVRLNDTAVGQIQSKTRAINTADGIAYSYSLKPGSVYGLTDEDKNNTIGRMLVDVNGNRKPNKYGRDVFFFYLVNKKGFVPAGLSNHSSCTKSSGGETCAARILQENEMKY